MRLTIAWLIVLFVTVTSGDSSSSSDYSEEKLSPKVEGNTEGSLQNSTEKSAVANKDKLENTRSGQKGDNEENNIPPDKDMTSDLLFQIERAIDPEDKIMEEKNQETSISNDVENNEKGEEDVNNPEDPIESKIRNDFFDIRRQETNSEDKQTNSNPAIQFDDSKTRVTSSSPQRFGERSRKFKQQIQDAAPVLILKQGGYERPYLSSFRERYSLRPESSEQSENIQKPDRITSKRRQATRRIVPQMTYSPSPESPYIFGQGPFINPAFDASTRNVLSMNQILPSPEQNALLNPPSTEFTSYSTGPFQPQSSAINDIGSVPNLTRDLNNVGIYQTLSSNPFQFPEIVYQNSPQPQQQQPLLIDAGRNIPSQFQQNPLSSHPGFQTMEVSSTPNYAALLGNPAANVPFGIPSNFYGNAPNGINSFNNPPISFISQYPNFQSSGQPQLLRYPDIARTQNYQPSSNIKQFDSDTSQDENKATETIQNADKPVNRVETLQSQLGTGLQPGTLADVFMRYPTAVAGYAIEENLPKQNNSEESSNDSKETNRQTNISNNPYRNLLNSVRNNQRTNNSFGFPPEIFRGVPIDFLYQRPQSGIFMQYPDRNREASNNPIRNFESRVPFNLVASLPESLLRVNNQQYPRQESNETPSCANESNASVCFEDKEYPINDILYFLNSNAFLADSLLNPEPTLKLFSFVERIGNETEQGEENYACDVATQYGTPLRAKNLSGLWRIIVNLQGRFSQSVRMEVCKTLGSTCSHTDSQTKTSCVQKYNFQRLLSWSPIRGIYSDVYKIPVACSCQII